MNWKRINSDPVATQSQVAVFCPDTEAEGLVRLRWPGQQGNSGHSGGGPVFFGPVTDGAGKVIDAEPTFA